MSVIENVISLPFEYASKVFGTFDVNVKKIEKVLNVSVVLREKDMKIIGNDINVERAKRVFIQLFELAKRGNEINDQIVDYSLSLVYEDEESKMIELDDDIICRTITGKPVKPKTLGQKEYLDQIKKNLLVFGIGPAGTGKTYLAIAMAVTAFKNAEVSRIILTRPAIEAGENLGFLPGDLQSKVDPYLRPLYDALYTIMGPDSFAINTEKGLIEVAPLAYMRGRTLDKAFIILDEAQNTTQAQMKMFLTRIGFGSKVIITGDLTQKDLPQGVVSGLDMAAKILKDIDDISFVYLTNKDVVRHPLVQKIVMAYENYERKIEKNDKKSSEYNKNRRQIKNK